MKNPSSTVEIIESYWNLKASWCFKCHNSSPYSGYDFETDKSIFFYWMVCSFCRNFTKIFWVSYFVKFVLGRFSHFNIAIAYSNSKFCGAWTPSFCMFTCNFGKTSTPRCSKLKYKWKICETVLVYFSVNCWNIYIM